MIDLSTLTPAQLAQLAATAAAESARRRKAGSDELRRRLEAIAEAEGYTVNVTFVSHRKRGKVQAQLALPAPSVEMDRCEPEVTP